MGKPSADAESRRGTERGGGGLRLTVVGCSAAWNSRSLGAASCYLVEHAGTAIVLDMGQGAFAALSRHVDPAKVTAIFVSHVHADHCIDLIPLRHYLAYGMDHPGTVRLHAPAGLRSRFDEFTSDENFLAPLPGGVLTEGTLEVPPFEVTARLVRHTDESYAFRVTAGGAERGLVYSGDCGDPIDLVRLIRPGDTLLCEALFGAGPIVEGPNHLDARMAAEAARDGGAARLILTHLQDGSSAAATRRVARTIYGGEVLVARPGLAVDIP